MRHVRALIWRGMPIAVLLSLAACDSAGTSAKAGAVPTPTTTPVLIRIATTPTPYPTPLVPSAATTDGWAIYHDDYLPVAFPVPPGWRVATYHDYALHSTTELYYTVGLIPPDADRHEATYIPPESHGATVSPHGMSIHVTLDGNPGDPTLGHSSGVIRMPGSLLVGGARAVVYDNQNGPPSLERWAIVTLEGSQYDIECHRIFGWNVAIEQTQRETQEDLSLFYAVLAGFRYTGAKGAALRQP